jgi:hypothetical protein
MLKGRVFKDAVQGTLSPVILGSDNNRG